MDFAMFFKDTQGWPGLSGGCGILSNTAMAWSKFWTPKPADFGFCSDLYFVKYYC